MLTQQDPGDYDDPEINFDSLVWILVTELAVRGVPRLPLGPFMIPVIQRLDDADEERLLEQEEEESPDANEVELQQAPDISDTDELGGNSQQNETGRSQVEEDEFMSAGPTSRKRQWREVAAMQRRFHVLRSSVLTADEGDNDYQPSVSNWRFHEHPMTLPQRQRPPQRWSDIGVGEVSAEIYMA